MKKCWILYDERARITGDTDDCAVLVSSTEYGELSTDSDGFAGQNAIWAAYDVNEKGVLVNEELLPDLFKAILCRIGAPDGI